MKFCAYLATNVLFISTKYWNSPLFLPQWTSAIFPDFWHPPPPCRQFFKGPRFSEKYWYYLQAQTNMPFHYRKLVVWIFAHFLLHRTKCNIKNSSLRWWFGIFFEPHRIFCRKATFSTIRRQFWPIFDPSPLPIDDVVYG